MAEIRHYINGQDFGEPKNWQELELTVDWLTKNDSGAINANELEFNLEANNYLQQRLLNGLTGGVGVFEGEPYRIEVGNQQNPTFVFDGYLDFTDGVTVLGGEEIKCSLKKKKGDDWLNDVADGFSFAYLYDKGVITDGDFVKVPYVINFIPDGLEIIMLSISLYMMTKELIENVQNLAESIADLTDASTPVIGASVGLGAGVVTAWDIGNFILATLKVLARLAYIIAIVIAIKNLIEEIFAQLLSAKREHLGMTFGKMYEKACQHLGLTFSSSLLQQSEIKNWVHIPQKNQKGGESGETGFPTNSGAIYTFGDLIRVTKEMFNADYRIKNGVFLFERKDQFQQVSGFVLPKFFNEQERLLQKFELNTDEMISNYNIFWSLDVQDQNTLENSDGRVFQAITSANAVQNEDFVTIKNLAQIEIPFSLGLEKRELTTVEEILKILAGVVDGLTGIFGGGTNFVQQIENRNGSLLLSSHFLTTGKVVFLKGSKLANGQRQLLDAKNLWDKYHFINSFAVYKGIHNQYFKYKEQPVPMTIQDFSALLESNTGSDENGDEYEIEKIIYKPYDDTALIDYRIKKQYTKNLKIELL